MLLLRTNKRVAQFTTYFVQTYFVFMKTSEGNGYIKTLIFYCKSNSEWYGQKTLPYLNTNNIGKLKPVLSNQCIFIIHVSCLDHMSRIMRKSALCIQLYMPNQAQLISAFVLATCSVLVKIKTLLIYLHDSRQNFSKKSWRNFTSISPGNFVSL